MAVDGRGSSSHGAEAKPAAAARRPLGAAAMAFMCLVRLVRLRLGLLCTCAWSASHLYVAVRLVNLRLLRLLCTRAWSVCHLCVSVS